MMCALNFERSTACFFSLSWTQMGSRSEKEVNFWQGVGHLWRHDLRRGSRALWRQYSSTTILNTKNSDEKKESKIAWRHLFYDSQYDISKPSEILKCSCKYTHYVVVCLKDDLLYCVVKKLQTVVFETSQ